MATRRLLVALALIGVLGAVGFFAARGLLGDGGGTRAQQPRLIEELEAIQTQEAEQRAEPRFAGELLGIHIAPSLDRIPREVWEEDVRLSAAGCEPLPLEQAGALAFPRGPVMPEGYVFSDADPANTGSNPGALACGGKLRSLGWGYTTTSAQGIPATVSIVRITTNYDTQDIAASQVLTQVIGGREAVVVRPASPDGLAQRYLIYFPEPFGMTAIQAFNLPEAEVLRVAEAVAEATR